VIRCPSCHTRIVRKSSDGKLKIRTSILAIGKSLAGISLVEVVCKKCGTDVPIDLTMGIELEKALSEPIKRLVISK